MRINEDKNNYTCHLWGSQLLDSIYSKANNDLVYWLLDVLFPLPPTQYCLTATNIFSGTRGPSSWSISLIVHLMPPAIFLTLFMTSTSSLKMTAPSGLNILSTSRSMSSSWHLFKHLHISCHNLKVVKTSYKWSCLSEENPIKPGFSY